jgi:pilus assembly protein Flp/PilA
MRSPGFSYDTPARGKSAAELRMKNFVTHFLQDESGVTSIEYGLIAALISVVCIAAMTAVGTRLQAVYTSAPLSRFVADESGATAIEYSLIAGLISVVVIGALTPVGAALNAVYMGISTVLAAAL